MAEKLNKDAVYRAAKPKEKDYTINDGGGLVLLVKSSGVKTWRFIYRFKGKQNRLGFGAYPDITLETARRKTEEARAQIANGVDPSETKKQAKQSEQVDAENAKRKAAGLPILNSFEHVARNWLAANIHTVRDITHNKKIGRFELHVFPVIGDTAISNIKSPDIFSLIKPLFNKLETAHRVHAEISSVFSYAIAHGLTDYDPAQAVGAQIPAKKVKHRAALTEPKDVAQLLRDIYCYQGTFVVQCAFRLSPLIFQRPGEIRQMEWKDVDLNAKEWRYFVTKTEVLHIVPLSTQAAAILEEIKPLTGGGHFVFPSS
ncbi:MAG: integrase arm-type DNA-binding domain-containing protein, partial [Methylococcaceae bacterium]